MEYIFDISDKTYLGVCISLNVTSKYLSSFHNNEVGTVDG